MYKPTLLIVAHGSRRQTSNEEVRALARQLAIANHPYVGEVEVAFLELAEPSIADGLAACVGKGAREIIVFPYFLAAGTHVAVDIPEEIEAFSAKHSGGADITDAAPGRGPYPAAGDPRPGRGQPGRCHLRPSACRPRTNLRQAPGRTRGTEPTTGGEEP